MNNRIYTDIGRHWLTNRVVNDWNRLGGHLVSADSIGSFKICIQEDIGSLTEW